MVGKLEGKRQSGQAAAYDQCVKLQQFVFPLVFAKLEL